MPILNMKYLETSLLQGLLLFLHIYYITTYDFLFCFITAKTTNIIKSNQQKTLTSKKNLYFLQNPEKAYHKIVVFFKYCLQNQRTIKKLLKYTLQKTAYSTKLSRYLLKALKSSQNIQKSSQELEKALKTYSLYLLFSMKTGLFTAFSQCLNTNSDNNI